MALDSPKFSSIFYSHYRLHIELSHERAFRRTLIDVLNEEQKVINVNY
jgi:hypothetical protein